MDEPFTGLDQAGVEVVCGLIREARDGGIDSDVIH